MSAELSRVLSRPEPYRGVEALFDADVHAACPGWAPREDHLIVMEDGVPLLTGTGEDALRERAGGVW